MNRNGGISHNFVISLWYLEIFFYCKELKSATIEYTTFINGIIHNKFYSPSLSNKLLLDPLIMFFLEVDAKYAYVARWYEAGLLEVSFIYNIFYNIFIVYLIGWFDDVILFLSVQTYHLSFFCQKSASSFFVPRRWAGFFIATKELVWSEERIRCACVVSQKKLPLCVLRKGAGFLSLRQKGLYEGKIKVV